MNRSAEAAVLEFLALLVAHMLTTAWPRSHNEPGLSVMACDPLLETFACPDSYSI